MYAIKSILNFLSHDKSSSSTNQAAFFDYVLWRENKVKHFSLYQEQHFTKLGYSCASILDAMPYIQLVLMMVTRHFLPICVTLWNEAGTKPCTNYGGFIYVQVCPKKLGYITVTLHMIQVRAWFSGGRDCWIAIWDRFFPWYVPKSH